MASTLEGFAGLVLTKRGLAVRGWNSKVASLRRVLQAQDERINDDNIAVASFHLSIRSHSSNETCTGLTASFVSLLQDPWGDFLVAWI